MKTKDYEDLIDKCPYVDKYYICWSAANETDTKIEEGDELNVGLLIINKNGITDEKVDICLSKHSNNKEYLERLLKTFLEE